MNNFSSPEDENSCCESDSQLVKKGKRRGRLREPSGSTSSSCMENVSVPMTSVDSGHIEHAVGNTPMASYNEERMRRKLQFFFMNPIEKWQARRRFPYKFFVQVVKIILVTIQLCLFAHSRYNHINYTWDNRVTFSHLFLNGWDESREVESYPPSVGPLALYVQSDFFDTIDYAIEG
uniref:Uncharacterized protein n=2 Tax=Phlebotomus papatasi TaxID=29031 RepID=A0A240SY86_PHLPP